MKRLDRIHGCLLGLAAGDAMGMPALHSVEKTKAIFGGEITTFIDASQDPAIDPVHHLLPAGMITDDTHSALAIVKSVTETKTLSLEALTRHYIAWVDETDILTAALGCQRGFAGPSTRASINQLKAGIPPTEAGKAGTTNGAAMRAAPAGFIAPGDIKTTVAVAEFTCIPTHNTNVAISAASAIACAVSACAGGERSIEAIIDAAKEGAELGKERGHKVYCPSIAKRIDLAMQLVSAGKDTVTIRQDIHDLIGAFLAAYEMAPAALAMFVLGQGDPVETIRLAINMGGDPDTLGAIAGALAGAYRGISAFPSSYGQIIDTVNGLHLGQVSADYLAAVQEIGLVGLEFTP